MAKTLYLNLDDDVARVAAKVKRERASDVVLVFPKKSFIFSDSINLRLLKKQLDLLGAKAAIMTMDEKGQMYAREAGFEIKYLTKSGRTGAVSDIRQSSGAVRKPARIAPAPPVEESPIPVSRPRVRKVVRRPAAPRVAAPVVIASPRPTPVVKRENVFLPPEAPAKALPKRRSYRRWVIAFISLALIVALLLVLVILPSASVAVYAKSQSVARDIDIIADTKATSVDSSRLTIPATVVNESQSIDGNFQTMGKKETGSKAEGRVAIINLTGGPLNLKAGTTTLSVGSKVYVFKADQSGIKPVAGANDEANASVADIVASEGGEGFNLPAGTRMEITNQAFGSQPTRLYAKTVSQVVGGTSRFISVVTKDDITKAQETLTNKVIDNINSRLKTDNQMLVNGSFTVNISSFTTDQPENAEVPTFNAQEQISVNGLAINENALKEMIRQRFAMSLGSSKTLQDPSMDTVVYKVKNIDTTNGLMQVSLHYESKAIPALDVNNLESQIAGKSKADAAELILSNPDVDRVEITLAPTWQTSLPRFTSKIKLEIKE